jgi:hypothetical protein
MSDCNAINSGKLICSVVPGGGTNQSKMMGRLIAVTRLASMLLAVSVVLCASQLPFGLSSSGEAAKAVSVTGQVSLLNDGQPWALSAGDQVKVGQVIFSGPDGYAVFQVSDGSTFEVYANSRVVFRKTPGNLKDLLDVVIGRIKVHIEKFGGQPNFNRIFTPTAVISVRGTTFDVEVEDSDETTLVVVEEGVVEVQHARHPGTPKWLNGGEWLRIYKNQPLASSRIDKYELVKGSLRRLADALSSSVYRGPRVSTVGGGVKPPIGGGGGPLPGDTGTPPPPPLPGDTGGTTPPSPPPPPPGS